MVYVIIALLLQIYYFNLNHVTNMQQKITEKH